MFKRIKDNNMQILIFPFILLLSFCHLSTSSVNAGNKLKVAVSIVPQKTFVKEIAGDSVEVITVIPPGYSPANYAPSPKHMKDFSDADIYFSLGLPAETAGILSKINSFNKDIKIVRLDKKISQKYSTRKLHNGKKDPHIWLSPKRVKTMIDIMEDELIKINGKAKYRKKAEQYKSRIADLDRYIENKLENLDKNTFIIYHPVLGYYAQDYDLKMVVIEKDGKKAAPRRIQKIIDIGMKNKIKSVFYQKTATSRQAKIIAEELGGKTIKINPFDSNYIANMKKITNSLITVLE